MPKISIIVPVYKCENYIHRCVNSVLNQTFTDFELILVDDGSPDNCGEICNEYIKMDNRVTVIHKENGGQASARNSGVAKAKADWLFFVDSDDAIHPQTLEKLYPAVVENNTKIGTCNLQQGNQLPENFSKELKNSPPEILALNEDNLLNLSKNVQYYYWVIGGKILHKSIYEKYPLTEGRIYEDNAVVCKWLHEAGKITILDEKLYFYYVNTTSTTKKAFNTKQLDVLWAFREQIEFFDSLGYKKMLDYLCTYYFEISANMQYRAKTENAKKLIPYIKEQEKEIKTLYVPYIKLNAEQKLYYYERTSKPMFYITRIKKKLGLLK